MAKMLWLLRHFHAVSEPLSGGRDRDRRLSSKGAAAARELGGLLAEGAIDLPLPECVLVSPAVRTRSSAEGVFQDRAELIGDARLYHATPDDVLDIVRELPDELTVVGIVGHNPTIHCLSLDLVTEHTLEGAHPAATSYPPGTLSIVELPIDRWAEASFGEGALRLQRRAR
jgi:phosphohistidine phosphatase